jgi:two-component system sensor histidine kinase CpxA
VRTENPTRYWVVVRLPPAADGPEGPGRFRPLALIGMAESLGQSPLLFDPKPWLLGGLGLLTASALLWWPFVRGLTRALAQMRGATERIARGDFSVRVDDRRGDELGRLGGAINAMTGRLDGFVSGQKRFLGDIAHELCSPLARMEMGLGILEQRTPPDQRDRLVDVRGEVREMSSLVHELLAFSKAGLQESAAVREPVALGPLVDAVVAREAGGAAVTAAVPGDLGVLAAPSLLSRAVGNVLRNAVHHGGATGPIEITASQASPPPGDDAAGEVLLTIADHGPGVPAEALPKLFDPFFRVDSARARETGGVGLGLAIVKSCVEACGGSVSARARTDDQPGLVVELRLPAAR